MATIGIEIEDPTNRMTLKAMLEAEGHSVVGGDQGSPLLISDDLSWAVAHLCEKSTVLVLARADHLSAAVQTMRQGVYGYIFLPFQAGEAGLMVQRALASQEVRDTPQGKAPDHPVLTLEAVEATHILETLRRCKNNQAKAARMLGIGRNTLWRKLKKIEIQQKVAKQEAPSS